MELVGHSQISYSLLPAFQGFNLPGINLAEVGNSMIKCHKPMSLAVAAWQDMIMMIIQDHDYNVLLNQSGKVSGKGLNLKQHEEQECQAESRFIEQCVETLEEGDIEAEAMMDMDLVTFLCLTKKQKTKFHKYSAHPILLRKERIKGNKRKNQRRHMLK